MRDKNGRFIKGSTAPKTAFKKGQISWNKGKKMASISGDKHYCWKGENVSYVGLHRWVRKNLWKAKQCLFCDKTNQAYKIHWANKDRKYRRSLDDFIPLCVSCHKLYDLKMINDNNLLQ